MNTYASIPWLGPKQKRAAQIPQAVWDRYKDEIFKLHGEGVKVDDLMIEMQMRHDFTATKHQFVLQLKKWDRRRYKSTPRGLHDPVTDSEASTPANLGIFNNEPSDADLSVLPLPIVKENLELGGGCGSQNELGNVLDSFTQVLQLQSSMPGSSISSQPVIDESARPSDTEQTQKEMTAIGVMERKSSRSSDLRRVPRAKRRRSTSTKNSAPSTRKRHRNDESDPMETNVDNVWDTILANEDILSTSPTSANNDSIGNTLSRSNLDTSAISVSTERTDQDWMIRSAVPSLHSIADVSAMQDSKIDENSPLKQLLRYAEQGSFSGAFSYDHIREIQHLAGFFFGAALYEEAFLLYMLVYRTLRTAVHTSKDVLLSIIINISRSSTTKAQDEIVRSLLLQALRKRHRQSTGEPHENFLINAFLTIIFRRQRELSKADHHCHRAIHCLDQPPAASKGKVMNSWRALAVVACTKLDYNITQERLFLTRSEISIDARRKVCSRASDQLITALQSYWTSESSMVANTCVVVGPDVLFNSHDGPFIAQPKALRLLYEWCLQALGSTCTEFDSRHPWHEYRAKGMKLRAIGITTLYCQLWKHWRSECGEMPLVNTVSDYWSVGIEEQLGIPADECLAAIPETIAVTWPFDDESMPMLANWRTYLAELHRRAACGLKALLQQTDIALAHFFLQAYSTRCIAEPRPDEVHSRSLHQLHRECVLAFAMGHIDLNLPILDTQSTVQGPPEMLSTSNSLGQGSSPVIPSAVGTTDVTESSMISTNLRTNRVSEIIDALAPVAYPSSELAHPLARTGDSKNSRKSIKTVSTDLASMLSVHLRTNHANTKSGEGNVLEPPSSAIRDGSDIDMNVDSIMNLARNSMDSLSLYGSVHERESNDAGSMTRLLNSSSSQLDVFIS